MRTAVFTVTYPAAAPFWKDFITSLRSQSDQEFELLIVNDGCSCLPDPQVGLGTSVRDESGTAAYLRKVGIEWARVNGFDIVVFADADDWCDTERVKTAKKRLRGVELFVNDLVLFGDTIEAPVFLLNSRFKEDQSITAGDLRNSNCLGLSNTSARVNTVSGIAKNIPDDQIAFDWALFASCVIAGGRALYSGETRTHYRQHSSNIAGLCRYDAPNIMRGVRIKVQQYALLREVNPWYKKRLGRFQDLYSRLETNLAFRQSYCDRIRERAGPSYLLWWEHIRLESEL